MRGCCCVVRGRAMSWACGWLRRGRSLVSCGVAGAIGLGGAFPGAIAAAPPGRLKLVLVDQAKLSSAQQRAFQRFVQQANFPPTRVGDRCRYHGKPQIWCLLLEPATADAVYQRLIQTGEFGQATEIRPVRPLRSPDHR